MIMISITRKTYLKSVNKINQQKTIKFLIKLKINKLIEMICQTLDPFFNCGIGFVVNLQGLTTACIILEFIIISILRLSWLGLFMIALKWYGAFAIL